MKQQKAYATAGVQWALPFNISNPVLFYNKRVFEAAARRNLPVKMHAEQLSNSGGAALAAREVLA